MNNFRRVVITGMGTITPFGIGTDSLWEGLTAGKSAVGPIKGFDTTGMPVSYAAEVDEFDASEVVGRSLPTTRDKPLRMAFVAAARALDQAGLLKVEDRQEGTNIHTVVGTALGPCFEHEYSYGCYFQHGWKGVRPTTVPKSMFNSYGSQLSIEYGLTGMNQTIACACASGAAAIGYGYQMIKHGCADIVLAGGVDSPLCPSMFAAWTNLRVLAKHKDPQRASRPFDKGRSGLVLSEGGAMIVLEAEHHAIERGATPLSEVTGFGVSSDSSHLTAPTIEGPVRAINAAMVDADLKPADINYVSAHGTGTVANDENEARAVHQIFGNRGSTLPMSSCKSMLGHSMGASSAIEAVVCVEAINHGWIPATLNCDDPDLEDLALDFVPGVGRQHTTRHALSNSFGFGGTNCVLIFSRFEK